MPPMTGDALKAWRRRRGWTQAQAAAWWGVSPRQWRRYETGASRIKAALARTVRRARHEEPPQREPERRAA